MRRETVARYCLLATLLALHAAKSASAAPPDFGFNDPAIRVQGAPVATIATLAQGVGSPTHPTKIERIELGWSDVAYNQGQLDWTQYDQIYSELTNRGIRPLWIVMRAPDWARNPVDLCPPGNGASLCPPSDLHLGAWREFVRQAVLRYPSSAGIEVWNEPNLRQFWNTATGPDPARYVRVLQAAYDGVKQANPSMPVLLGGSADPSPPQTGEWSMADWLNAVYLFEGDRRDFDVISGHFYPWQPSDGPQPPDVQPDGGSWMRQLNTTKQIRNAHGDSSKPIWITEFGYYTGTASGAATLDQQSKFLRCAYRMRIDDPDVPVFLVNQLVDAGTNPARIADNWGVARSDLSHKNAYDDLHTMFVDGPLTRVSTCPEG